MRKMLTMILRCMLAVGILTVISFAWGNQMVSPTVNYRGFFLGKAIHAWAVESDENYYLEWLENKDQTFTVTLFADGEFGGFDYGIAFSPEEVAVTDYGFTEEFKEYYSNQQGSVMNHYFSEGKRVSQSARYIVYGGMSAKTTSYDGPICYVTVSLIGEQASFYGVIDSAKFEHGSEMMTEEAACVVVKASKQPSKNDTSEEDAGKDAFGEDNSKDDASASPETDSSSGDSEDSSKTNNSQEVKKENSPVDTKEAKENISSKNSLESVCPVKTGDESNVVACLLAIIGATIALLALGRTFFPQKKKKPTET